VDNRGDLALARAPIRGPEQTVADCRRWRSIAANQRLRLNAALPQSPSSSGDERRDGPRLASTCASPGVLSSLTLAMRASLLARWGSVF
jgi:hypothetical protein